MVQHQRAGNKGAFGFHEASKMEQQEQPEGCHGQWCDVLKHHSQIVRKH